MKAKGPHLRLRLEPQLLERLEKARINNGRTLTGEIAKRLERTFAADDLSEIIKVVIKACKA